MLLIASLLLWSAAATEAFIAPQGSRSHVMLNTPRRRTQAKLFMSTEVASPWELTLFSPAKINLFLRCTGKRPDGYNNLASLFQTVGFGDTLYFSKLTEGASSDVLTSNFKNMPLNSSNLVTKALALFRKRSGINRFFKVHIEKVIPTQAGLGGGSSNAATALWAANELLGRPYTTKDLEDWSAEIGSDITFFLSSGTCYCTGRGEILHPQPKLSTKEPSTHVWLFKPEAGLSTPSVFKQLTYNTCSNEDPLLLLEKFNEKGTKGAVFINDLEPPAFKVLPELKSIKADIVKGGFQTVLMSGSGSTIFALGRPTDLEWPLRFVKEWDCFMYRTSFINRDEDSWYVAKT